MDGLFNHYFVHASVCCLMELVYGFYDDGDDGGGVGGTGIRL